MMVEVFRNLLILMLGMSLLLVLLVEDKWETENSIHRITNEKRIFYLELVLKFLLSQQYRTGLVITVLMPIKWHVPKILTKSESSWENNNDLWSRLCYEYFAYVKLRNSLDLVSYVPQTILGQSWWLEKGCWGAPRRWKRLPHSNRGSGLSW